MNKEKNFKESVGKIRSLMERVEGNMSPYEASVNEQMRIDEATAKNRVQVTRDEILDILDMADDAQNESNKGLFATITYVKPASLLKTKRSIDNEKLSSALENHADKSEEEWHKNLSSFRDAEKSTTKNPISAIVTVTRYLLRWHSPSNYNSAYNKYKTALSDLRMKNGIAVDSDGMLGDNKNQRQSTDATGSGQFNQTGNFARDFNMAAQVGKPKSTAYIVDDNGNIVSELPNEVMWSLHQKRGSSDGVESEVKKVLTGPALEEYAKAKAELDAEFSPRNLLFDRVLSICCSVNGTSYYYINDMLITKISKGSEVNVNPNEMVEIAKEQIGESFDGIQGFAN